MNQAVFLDRDGVINEVLTDRVKFVNKPEDFYLLEGVGEGIKLLKEAGYKVFVVTNQGGIGLGFMKESMLHNVHDHMQEQLEVYDAQVDAIAYCPHKPHENCPCRKPMPKMIHDLAEEWDIDLEKSYMIGDREPDIVAGRQAGTKTILVGTRDKHKIEADMVFNNLLEASKYLTNNKS
ncbi:D-glycero-alpha-D-manno-heptose-1,7-bisphosphate 7-phosphatase [Oceanobacillus manasiensis]|uniref:D-glycero-alpha-D-manno-heptose-1,7-bisphosphate 7-phosphatase n=1 Tax=Oceanobacillus manasiensis TaxID=586413 RepID=UPI0005A83C99|nr:HAD family hydrolase [Oceanobacillus manasiensis]